MGAQIGGLKADPFAEIARRNGVGAIGGQQMNADWLGHGLVSMSNTVGANYMSAASVSR